MGMYTEIYFRGVIKKEGNEQVVDFLTELFATGEEPDVLPNHALFRTDRWMSVFFGGSAYFPEVLRSEFREQDYSGGKFCELGIHSNLKNYNHEIDLFFDWIDPLIIEPSGTFLGYSLYEEGDSPDLFFKG